MNIRNGRSRAWASGIKGVDWTCISNEKFDSPGFAVFEKRNGDSYGDWPRFKNSIKLFSIFSVGMGLPINRRLSQRRRQRRKMNIQSFSQ